MWSGPQALLLPCVQGCALVAACLQACPSCGKMCSDILASSRIPLLLHCRVAGLGVGFLSG